MSAELAEDLRVLKRVGGNRVNGVGVDVSAFYGVNDVNNVLTIKNRIITSTPPIDSTSVVDIFGDGFGVALWQFNDNTDELSGNYSPTISTPTTYVAGKVGQAVSLNGADNIEGPPILTGTTTEYSISVWVNINSFADYNAIYNTFYNDNVGGVDYKGHILRVNTSGQVQMANMWGGTFGTSDYILSSPIALNTWTHIVCTWGAGVGTIYLDGVSNISGGMQNVVNEPTKDYIIGNLESPEGTKTAFFNGYLDQMRFFKSTLTQEQVTTLFNEGV